MTALLLLLLLTACAGHSPSPDEDRKAGQWRAQAERLAELERWALTGKVGLRTPEETTSATLDWQQYPHYYRLLISGPFGSGRTQLEGREGRVTLSSPEGRFEATSPEALMQQQLGWSLPVSALANWVLGLPANGSDFRLERDARGFPRQLQQQGWTLDYRDWTRTDGLWLPRRLVMTYDELRVTLVVTVWRLEPDRG